MKTSLVALAAALVMPIAVALPAYADEAGPVADGAADGAPITVLATGSDRALDQTGQAITVLPLQTIEAVQGVDLTRVLDRVPGLTWSRTGGLGAQTAVRLRGGEGQHTLVLVDGVRVEDPSAPSGGFDFGTLTSSVIERIEVLRGSNSVVWGSSAIGGVIAVTTREIRHPSER